MRSEVKLTAAVNQLQVNLQTFQAAALFVENPTGSPVAIRTGGTDFPSLANANHVVPANGYLLVPCQGTTFAFAFTDAVSVLSTALSNLLTSATITLFDATEALPNFGSATFLSLSLSDLSNGIVGVAGGSTSSVFDLGSWGGAILYLLATGASGQGIVTAQVSSDQQQWRTLGEWAFWPGLPATINVPRSVRYLRFVFAATAIPGEPAIAYAYSVRATLSEIFDLQFSALAGTIFTKAYNLAGLGEANWTFATRGLPAMSVGVKNTVGVSSQGELIVETANAATGPWRTVAFREQSIGPGGLYDSINRTYANLDVFTRVRMLSTNLVAIQGSVYVGILPGPDLAATLQLILAALGDPGAGVNVGQSIYHLLALINLSTDTLETLITASNVQLTAINANTDTLEALIASTNTALSAINTLITAMSAKFLQQATGSFYGSQFTCPAGTNNVFVNTGVDLPANCTIQDIQLSYNVTLFPLLSIACKVQLWLGTAGAPATPIFIFQGSQVPVDSGNTFQFTGPVNTGFFVPSGVTRLWVLSDQTPCTIQPDIAYRV